MLTHSSQYQFFSESKSGKHGVHSKFDYEGILQLHNLRKPDPPAKPDGGSKPDDSAKPVCPPKPGAPAKPDNAAMQQAHETSSTSITSLDTS